MAGDGVDWGTTEGTKEQAGAAAAGDKNCSVRVWGLGVEEGL